MTLVAVHVAATWAMVGVIWFVQMVHYPLFELASARRFERFAQEHQRRTSLVVVPLMLTEAVTAVVLLATTSGVERGLLWLGTALLAIIWLLTALVQVPLHRRLSLERDAVAMQRLVSSNWARTLAWTARGVLTLIVMVELAK